MSTYQVAIMTQKKELKYCYFFLDNETDLINGPIIDIMRTITNGIKAKSIPHWYNIWLARGEIQNRFAGTYYNTTYIQGSFLGN